MDSQKCSGFHSDSHDALIAACPQLKSPVSEAVRAGVPWGTILQWIIQYGPDLANKIIDLLKMFQSAGK